jgi:phospholipid/cholesterol/gamma-HCH transport system permease protein
MGTGAMAVVGGTVAIVGFVTLSAGSLVAIQGFASLGNIGVEAFTGFFAAMINVRFVAPVVTGSRWPPPSAPAPPPNWAPCGSAKRSTRWR